MQRRFTQFAPIPLTLAAILAACLTLASGCSQSTDGQFRLLHTEDSSDAGIEVGEVRVERHGAPVDLLFVVDNSGSMKPSQTKLANALRGFAQKFFRPGTDIQVGVVRTDGYTANPIWEKFLSAPIPNSTRSPRDFNPSWGPNAAKLSAPLPLKTRDGNLNSLISNFERAVAVGTNGLPEERGFGSVLQFLSDNETGSRPLFRKDSQRIIVFLSDENDQTVDPSKEGPEPRKLVYTGSSYTGTDETEANKILPYQITIRCAHTKDVIDGIELAPTTTCTRPELLMTTQDFARELNEFFAGLDGSSRSSYMIASIVAKEAKTIQELRQSLTGEIAHSRGRRYIDLANEVGNGSFSMDIGLTDYTSILERIGLEIENRSVVTEFKPQTSFTLTRVPTAGEPVTVTHVAANGKETVLKTSQFRIAGNVLEITDSVFAKTMKKGDRIKVNYHPSTVLPANPS